MMSKQQQLTEHFLTLSDSVSTDSPLMARRREEARELLRKKPLPKHGPEHYAHFDLGIFADTELRQSLVAESDLTPYRLLDDSRLLCSEGTEIEGCYVGPLSRFAELHPEPAKLFGTQHDLRDRAVPSLTDLLAEEAMILYVEPRCRVEVPLELIYLLGRGLSARHLLIICDEESRVTMMQSHRNLPEEGAAALITTEIYVRDRADLHLYDYIEQTHGTRLLHNVHARIGEDARMTLTEIVSHPERTRINLFIDLAGKHADLQMDGLAILRDDNLCDIWSNIFHSETDGHTDELFKYTLSDHSVGSFSGMIYVEPGAIRTDADQHNRNLLLSKEAKMYSKPQLEIYADDVKCSHGLATGLLDEAALFYMEQRGIPEDEAHDMLTSAFVHDVLVRIPDEQLREVLTAKVDARLQRRK